MNRRNIGSFGEELALEYLKKEQFELLARNYRCRIGEIDLIAKKDQIIRFIEVKYRKNSDYGAPVEAVSHRKQRKIYQCAAWYLAEQGWEDVPCSFDVISICGDRIEYIFNC